MTYPAADGGRAAFAGFRSVNVFISDTLVSEVSVVGTTVAEQQASLQLLARSMQAGYNVLAGQISGVLDITSATGLREDVPDAAAELIQVLFKESDCLTYDAVEVFAVVAEEDSLLEALADAGAALLALLP